MINFSEVFRPSLSKVSLYCAVLAGEHFVECLLEAFASLGFGPKSFVIVDDAVRITAGLSAVTDDLPGQFSIRINANINRPHDRRIAGKRSFTSSYSD